MSCLTLVVASKRCGDCGAVKPLDAFHRDPRASDGRMSACGECRNSLAGFKAAAVALRAEPWVSRARCRDMPKNDFFLDAGNVAGIARAKLVCSLCPVADACLDYALRTREPFGIFGGKTAAERRRILRSRRGDA